MRILPLITTLAQTALVLSDVLPPGPRSEKAIGYSKIVQFPNSTWLENIGARPNGNLLLVRIDKPEVWQVNPQEQTPTPTLVHRFRNATRTSGIAEVAPDVFAVIVGNVPANAISGGSWSLALLDFAAASSSPSTAATVKIVAPTVPGAQFLNGLEVLSPNALVLASDSSLGVVYRIDIRTGRSAVIIKDKSMSPMLLPIGVNGIHIRGNDLYFSNTARSLFARIPIDRTTGLATGPAETIYSGSDYLGADDFAISPDGRAAYATNQLSNSIFRIDLTKKQKKRNRVTIVDGGLFSGGIVGPTSLVFSRVPGEEKLCYVSTNNGAVGYAVGTLLGAPKAGGSVFSVLLS
jgi:hypothetical protein